VGSFTGSSKELPDQPVRTVPASSLLDNLAGQLEQAAALHRLGLVRRTPSQQPSSSQTQMQP
jgi:hypothetical protein